MTNPPTQSRRDDLAALIASKARIEHVAREGGFNVLGNPGEIADSIIAADQAVREATIEPVTNRTEQMYLALLLLPHNGLRARLQPELSACRDAVALMDNSTAEETQNRYEARAEKLRLVLWGLSTTEPKRS